MGRDKVLRVRNRTGAVARPDGRPLYTLGPTGPAGPQGDAGPQGPQGEQGPAGADGASSYLELTDIPLVFPPDTHSHLWAELTDPPATYAPAAHGHSAGLFERDRLVAAGEFELPDFDAADFTAVAGMTWTVEAADRRVDKYALVGKILHFSIDIRQSVTGGSAGLYVYREIPYGLISAGQARQSCQITDVATNHPGMWFVTTGGNKIGFFRFDNLNLPLSANFMVMATGFFEVQ